MPATAQTTPARKLGPIAYFRKRRRKLTKRYGTRLIRKLSGFFASQSLVDDRPVLDERDFDWARMLEQNAGTIRAELDHVLRAREDIPLFHEISRDQDKISKGDNWRTFVLLGFGYRAERNCARCPETTRLLEAVPGIRNAFFSILSPRYHVPAHRGVTKGVLRVHLGLIVPKDGARCRMRVGDAYFTWKQGECVVFDDTYDHEVWNDTDEERVILLFDVDRPMRWPGRLANSAFLRAIRWTAYVQDARSNVRKAEDRFEAAVKRADAMQIDSD